MAKKSKKRIIRKEPETIALPSAENAKWLAIGFLASAVMVSLFIAFILHAHGH